jgi:hypothetical protein
MLSTNITHTHVYPVQYMGPNVEQQFGINILELNPKHFAVVMYVYIADTIERPTVLDCISIDKSRSIELGTDECIGPSVEQQLIMHIYIYIYIYICMYIEAYSQCLSGR